MKYTKIRVLIFVCSLRYQFVLFISLIGFSLVKKIIKNKKEKIDASCARF